MPPFNFLFLALALLVSALVLMAYRQASNRAWEKKRNQYHDHVLHSATLARVLRLDIPMEGDELNGNAEPRSDRWNMDSTYL